MLAPNRARRTSRAGGHPSTARPAGPTFDGMPSLSQQCKDATLGALQALGGTATRTQIREWALEHGDLGDEHPQRSVKDALRWSLTALKREGVVFNVSHGTWTTAPNLGGPLLIDVAERHAELMGERQRRSLWSRLRAA